MMPTPLTPSRHTPPVRPWLLYGALGVTLLLALIAAYYLNNTAIRDKDRLRFHRLTQDIQDDIVSHLETYVALLRAGAGFVTAANTIDQEQFRTFTDRLHLDQGYPGMQGSGFSRRLQPEERAAVVLTRQLQGAPGFTIWPEYERAEYHTALYLEPLNLRNAAALGYAMFTEPVRRAAMERARDTGRPAASGKVILKQEIDAPQQAGFLIYVPVYKAKTIPESLDERRDLLLGFVYSPFRVGDFLRCVITPVFRRDVAFKVFAGARGAPAELIYQSREEESAQLPPPQFTTTVQLDIYGQPWSIAFATLPSF